MLKVTVEKQQNIIKKVSLKGHALYDDFGKDIVCSAASSILTTTVNGILSFDKDNLAVEMKKDLVVVTVLKDNEIVNTLMNNFYDLIVELETSYPKNIKID